MIVFQYLCSTPSIDMGSITCCAGHKANPRASAFRHAVFMPNAFMPILQPRPSLSEREGRRPMYSRLSAPLPRIPILYLNVLVEVVATLGRAVLPGAFAKADGKGFSRFRFPG